MIPFLTADAPFPPLATARPEFDGLLAIGADLSPARLLAAYRQGIFPWGTHEGWPLWHAPDPRMVLFPDEFTPSRSLRKTLRQGVFEIDVDRDFAGVIDGCASQPRAGQDGTWISPEMRAAYCRLFELGWAHSVEARQDGELVGGLYGLSIGGMFYGESMFARRTDASKAALASLIGLLRGQGCGMIDCQMYTPHLASLGARLITRAEFQHRLARLLGPDPQPGRWTRARLPAD